MTVPFPGYFRIRGSCPMARVCDGVPCVRYSERSLFGGWKFSGVTTAQSGFPFTAVLSNNATLNADFTQRPDIIGEYKSPIRDRDRWYNPGAFAAPQCCRLGNAGTNIIRGPQPGHGRLGVRQGLPVRESSGCSSDGRTSTFFNHAESRLPINAVDSPIAGRILGLAGSQTFGGAGSFRCAGCSSDYD